MAKTHADTQTHTGPRGRKKEKPLTEKITAMPFPYSGATSGATPSASSGRDRDKERDSSRDRDGGRDRDRDRGRERESPRVTSGTADPASSTAGAVAVSVSVDSPLSGHGADSAGDSKPYVCMSAFLSFPARVGWFVCPFEIVSCLLCFRLGFALRPADVAVQDPSACPCPYVHVCFALLRSKAGKTGKSQRRTWGRVWASCFVCL